MVLDARTERRDGRRLDIGDEEHGVRVAHRERRHQHAIAVQIERDVDQWAVAVTEPGRDLLGREDRAPHLDHDPVFASPARTDDAAQRLDRDLARVRVVAVPQPLVEGADAVRAHLRPRAVRVVDVHAEVGDRRGARDQKLIAADPEATVQELPGERLESRQLLRQAVEHDEVVAGAVHLGELEQSRHGVGSSSTVSIVFSPAGWSVGVGAAAGAGAPESIVRIGDRTARRRRLASASEKPKMASVDQFMA
jgi:hypothetical protein